MVTGGARAVARCDVLGRPPYSDSADGLFRAYLSPGYLAAQQAVAEWMGEAGMTCRVDAAGNLVGRYPGAVADAWPLIIGSHLDSVRDAGRYDGPLGVLLGVECVDALHRSGRRLPFPVEVYAFGDEEGSRFPAAMLTSRAVAGTLRLEQLDVPGLDAALAQVGLSAAEMHAAAHPGARAYLEAHIEQGPVLEAEELPIGVVTGIAAQLRYRLAVTGTAGHAGTTTMRLRRDALAAAAEIVLAAERLAQDGGELVATVGQLTVAPGAANVIPGQVTFTLDVRALDQDVRDRAAAQILAAAEAIAAERGVAFEWERTHDLASSACDPQLQALLADAVAAAGVRPFHLPSGAGHDAMILTALCPTAMLFVRCRGGISHNPAEHVAPADAEVALQAMLGFIDRLESIT